MSWLAPTASDRDLVDQIEARSPTLYRLALVLAPALRVEPLLLRNARLHFLPQSDAGLESDLWFSPLVLRVEQAGSWLGIPPLYLYLFAVWALLIALAVLILSRSGD